MRKLRRAVSSALAGAMVLGLLAAASPAVSEAAKKPSISPKKLILTEGASKKVKLKNAKKAKKTKWSAKPSKAVKLSKKSKTGVTVKGLKAAKKVTLTAKFNLGKKKRTAKCTIRINAKRPKPTTAPKPTITPKATITPGSGKTADPVTDAPKDTPTPTVDGNDPTEPDKAAAEVATLHPIMEDLPAPADIPKSVNPPDVLKMWDGTAVTEKGQWEARRQEIKAILQQYMYGIWRTGENISYAVSSDKKQLRIKVSANGKSGTFNAAVALPQGTAPAGGWPVIVGVGGAGEDAYALERGYAIVTVSPGNFSGDGQANAGAASRVGIFYNLYPYDTNDWKTQTGNIMAWAWGASKVMDAFVLGADEALNINTDISIVTGTSRYGKAAACAGAFDERFTVSMPVSSGYGGMTAGRYSGNGITYNLLPDFANDPNKGSYNLGAYTYTDGNEPYGNLTGGWFNDNYGKFGSYQSLPLDAHYISALSASEGRFVFMDMCVANWDGWSSPAGMWYNYENAKPAFEMAGLEDNFAIHYHFDRHGIEKEDYIKLFAWLDYRLKEIPIDTSKFPAPWNEIYKDWTPEDLKTCVYASEANQAAYEEGKPKDPALMTPNPADPVEDVEIEVGGKMQKVTVSRSALSDGGVFPLTGEDAGKGFEFKPGFASTYGTSYAKFTVTLPKGWTLADYTKISFDICSISGSLYGKGTGIFGAQVPPGLPDTISYNYNAENPGNLVDKQFFDGGNNNTGELNGTYKSHTWNIDKTKADPYTGKIELCIYLQIEPDETNKTGVRIRNFKILEGEDDK